MENIIEYLKSIPKQKYYYIPNPGNAGDSLIAQGTYTVFRQANLNFQPILMQKNWRMPENFENELEDKFVIYGGGGNLVSYYNNAANILQNIHEKVKKLIILPHTINGHSELLKNMGANVDIICREKISYEYVKKTAINANVLLMDDLALSINIEETVNKTEKKIPVSYWARLIKQNIYVFMYFCKQILYSDQKKTLNAFRIDVEKTELRIPKTNFDLVEKFAFYNFDELFVQEVSCQLLSFLNGFDIVNTNRLHVCIASALLGKEVNFYPNQYYKNKAVYEFSLRDRFPKVHWISSQ